MEKGNLSAFDGARPEIGGVVCRKAKRSRASLIDMWQ
jgi:hypothetical protein